MINLAYLFLPRPVAAPLAPSSVQAPETRPADGPLSAADAPLPADQQKLLAVEYAAMGL